MEVKSLRQIMDEEFDPVTSLLGDGLLVPSGRLLFYGLPGSFKSFLVQQLAFCLATGQDWLGYEVHKKVRVHYIQAEIVKSELQRRVVRMERGTDWMGVHENLFFTRLYDFVLAADPDWRELWEALNESEAEVLIMDPVVSFMAGSENDGEAMTYFTRGMDKLRRLSENEGRDLSQSLVHHRRKPSTFEGATLEGGYEESRGHTQLIGWPDTIAGVRKLPDSIDAAELKWDKVRNGLIPHPRIFKLMDRGEGEQKSLMLAVGDMDPIAVMQKLAAGRPLSIKEFDAEAQRIVAEAGAILGQKKVREYRSGLVMRGELRYEVDPSDRKRRFVRTGERR